MCEYYYDLKESGCQIKILALTSYTKFNKDYFGKKIKKIGPVVRSESCKYVFKSLLRENVRKLHLFSGKTLIFLQKNR